MENLILGADWIQTTHFKLLLWDSIILLRKLELEQGEGNWELSCKGNQLCVALDNVWLLHFGSYLWIVSKHLQMQEGQDF